MYYKSLYLLIHILYIYLGLIFAVFFVIKIIKSFALIKLFIKVFIIFISTLSDFIKNPLSYSCTIQSFSVFIFNNSVHFCLIFNFKIKTES